MNLMRSWIKLYPRRYICQHIKYILVMKEDVTEFFMLETSAVANATHAAESLQRWCTTLGVPSVFVSDTASHFKNQLLRKLADGLGINHQFTVANSPWTNGTVESMMKEVKRMLKALLVEYRCAIHEWEKFVPMVQWALNSSHRQRLGCSPFEAFFGRKPTSMLAQLVSDHADVVDIVPVPEQDIQKMAVDLAAATDVMHNKVIGATQEMREAGRCRASKGSLPNFAVGDFVLVAKVRQAGKASKLMSTWSGPWRVTNTSTRHVYQVQNIVDGKVLTAHVARMKFYKDSSLGITAEIKETFQYLLNQGEFEMEAILEIRASTTGGYEGYVQWKGFSEAERSWEPIATLHTSSPSFVIKQLKGLKLSLKTRRALFKHHKIKVVTGSGGSLQ